MRKRVKKQLRKQEHEHHMGALERIHQLEVEASQLQRALRISEEHEGKLSAMFEKLREDSDAEIKHLKGINGMLGDTIDELKRPTWRMWFGWLKTGRIGD